MNPADLLHLPKVVLHDHLDGGLRPGTVLELAAEAGYTRLPADSPERLGKWFHQAGAHSLEQYLEAFTHTYGVMQNPEAMHRVAYEAVADMAAAGVVYAEIRFAPSLHIAGGMDRADAIAAVLSGLAAAEAEFGLVARVIVDALRHMSDSEEVARAALQFSGAGVVAFDLAGPERGHPASGHRRALDLARDGGLHLTIHAGEGDGVDSIADALQCGAERLGHGVRIVEDVEVVDGEVVAMGPVATEVHRRGVPLEVAPISNLDTAMYPAPEDHPVGVLHRAGFVVTLNTDNRLMSATSMVREYQLVTEHCGFSAEDLLAVAGNAAGAAFCDPATRELIRTRVAAAR